MTQVAIHKLPGVQDNEFAFQVERMAPGAKEVIGIFDQRARGPIDRFIPNTSAEDRREDPTTLPTPAHIADGYQGDMCVLDRVVSAMREEILRDGFYRRFIDITSLQGVGTHPGISVPMIHWMADILHSERMRWAPFQAAYAAGKGEMWDALFLSVPRRLVTFGTKDIDQLAAHEPRMPGVFKLFGGYRRIHMSPKSFVPRMLRIYLRTM